MSNQGDCISIKSNYFGGDFEKEINNLSFVCALVYGHVTEEVFDSNQDFTVKWDIDSQNICHYKTLFSCKYVHKIIEVTPRIHTADLTKMFCLILGKVKCLSLFTILLIQIIKKELVECFIY